jgi:hypothetical protein
MTDGSLTLSPSLFAISILVFLTLIVKPHACVALSKLNISSFSNFSVLHTITRSSAYSNSITLSTPLHKSPRVLRPSGILNSILTLPSYPFNAISSTGSSTATSLLRMMCVNTLPTILSRLMPLQLSQILLSPFLNNGTTIARSQSSGISSDSHILFITLCIQRLKILPPAFSVSELILSNPGVLVTSALVLRRPELQNADI